MHRRGQMRRLLVMTKDVLDIAIICEAKGDLDNALGVARKALQVTFDCRGPDCEDIRYYISIVRRVKQSMNALNSGGD